MKGRPCVLVSGSGYQACASEDATHLTMRFPGPVGELTLPVMIGGTRAGTGNWTWNGSVDSPTIKPSVKTTIWVGNRSANNDDGGPSREIVLHSHVNDGKASFLNDTTEDSVTQGLRGQTVDMLDVEPAQPSL